MLTEGTQATFESSLHVQSALRQAISAISELHSLLLDVLLHYKLCVRPTAA